jgi:hypothetical protein
MPRNLVLAYVATWMIHGIYLSFLFSKHRKLKRSMPAEEPKKKD